MDYEVARGRSFDELKADVGRLVKEGFIPQGGIAFGYMVAAHFVASPVIMQENALIFAQAMIRNDMKGR